VTGVFSATILDAINCSSSICGRSSAYIPINADIGSYFNGKYSAYIPNIADIGRITEVKSTADIK
jgi:hypothetical protein